MAFQTAHVAHLQGKYAEAERAYVRIEQQTSALDADAIETHWMARRQLGDLRMLGGMFSQARALFDCCERDGPAHPLWRLECARLQGHLDRFNGRWQAAQLRYDEVRARAGADRMLAMQGKAQVNLSETLWAIDPDRAIRHADLGIEACDWLATGSRLERH